jgi:hypothetical protein
MITLLLFYWSTRTTRNSIAKMRTLRVPVQRLQHADPPKQCLAAAFGDQDQVNRAILRRFYRQSASRCSPRLRR